MKRLRQRALLLLLASYVGAALHPALAQEGELRHEIEAVNRQFEAAIAEGNASALAALYTEGAQVLPQNSPAVQGRKAIQNTMQAMMDMGVQRIELKTLEVEGNGESAYEIGAYVLYDESEEPIDEGKYTVIWQKEGGNWKLHRDIWNSSRPASSALLRADKGEQVGIAIYRIKADKQAAFEQFVHEVLWPAATKVEPESLLRVRLWNPAGPEQEGVVRYAFVFDPYYEGSDYDIGSLLEKAYGRERAERHMRDFDTYVESYTYDHFVQER